MGSVLALSVFASQIHLVPLFVADGDIFPRPGEDVTVGDKRGNLAKPTGFD